jgi:Flp pilus assembly pilin Flp
MNISGLPGAEAAGYLRALLGAHAARLRSAVRQRDRGASAVELAVITAVLVAIAIALLAVIKTFVTNQSNQINSNTPAGGNSPG